MTGSDDTKKDFSFAPRDTEEANTHKGQASVRLKLHKMKVVKKSIEECPWILSERVARHYLKIGEMAKALLRSVELTRYNDFKETEHMRAYEDYALNFIFQEYCNDFGNEPSWWKALVNLRQFHKEMPVPVGSNDSTGATLADQK